CCARASCSTRRRARSASEIRSPATDEPYEERQHVALSWRAPSLAPPEDHMRSIIRGVATLATAVALAACSAGATSAPTTAAGTQAPPGSAAPAASTGGSAVCADSTGTTTVQATVGGFQWGPVQAKVGDVITW